MIVNVGDSVLS